MLVFANVLNIKKGRVMSMTIRERLSLSSGVIIFRHDASEPITTRIPKIKSWFRIMLVAMI